MSTYTQEDRMADQAYFANKAREEAIAKWLQENPQVGVLNSGKFYIIVNDEPKYIEAFSK